MYYSYQYLNQHTNVAITNKQDTPKKCKLPLGYAARMRENANQNDTEKDDGDDSEKHDGVNVVNLTNNNVECGQ
jgi:hypothetical protein